MAVFNGLARMIGRAPINHDMNVLILAAGLSRRMGAQNKLLLNIDGEPMVRKTAAIYKSIFASVTLVLGYQQKSAAAALEGLGVELLYNADFEAGLQSSLAFGLKHLSKTAQPIMIALADQPFLTAQDLTRYAAAYKVSAQDKAFIPFYKGQRGHPVIVPPALLQQFHQGRAGMTLRAFLETGADKYTEYDAPTVNFIKDIDGPEDLA